MAKSGGGKVISGLLCFLIGLIVGLAAELAVIAGGIYWLYSSAKIESLFNLVSVDNTTTDETTGEVTYIYIDTSEVQTISDLVSTIRDLANDGITSCSISDLSVYFPVFSTLADTIYDTVQNALSLSDEDMADLMDKEELKDTPLNELTTYLKSCLSNIQIATLLELAGIDVESSAIYLALAYGSEAGTVEYNGATYPVYYATYTYDSISGKYLRSGDNAVLGDDYVQYLYADGEECKLYFAVIDGSACIATRSGSTYTLVESTTAASKVVAFALTSGTVDISNLVEYTAYSADYATATGGYYYDAEGTLQTIEGANRYIGDLVDEEGSFSIESIFDDILVSSFLTSSSEDGSYDVLMEAFEGLTLGDLINDGLDIEELFGDVLVTDLLGGDDETIASIFEGMTLGELMSDGIDIDTIMDTLYVDDVMDVDPTNAVMAFIGYNLTGVTEVDSTAVNTIKVKTEETNEEGVAGTVEKEIEYKYTATLHLFTEEQVEVTDENGNTTTETQEVDNKYTAYVVVDENNYITAVYFECAVAEKIEDYNGQYITANESLGITADSGYLIANGGVIGYSYTYTTNVSGNSVTAYVAAETDENGVDVITGIYYLTGESQNTAFTGVSVGDISAQTDRLMNYVTIGEITELGDSALEEKLKDYTVGSVSDFINELSIEDVMGEVTTEDSAIIRYLVYGITDLSETCTDNGDGTYTFTATYHDLEGNPYSATVIAEITQEENTEGKLVDVYATDDDGNTKYDSEGNPIYCYTITAVYYTVTETDESGAEVTVEKEAQTLVDDINDRIDGLMEDVKIGEITDLGDSKLEQKLSEYTVDNISQFIDELTLADVMEDVSVNSDSHAIMDYLVYGLTNVTAVTYKETEGETTTTYTKTVTIDGVEYYVYTAVYNTYDSSEESEDKAIAYNGKTVYVLAVEELDDENIGTGNYIISAIYTEDSLTEGDKTFTLATTVTDITSTLGTPVDNINDRMDGLMNDLTIGEITELGDSALEQKLSTYTINNISQFIEDLTLADVMEDVSVNSDSHAIMDYLVYGLKEVTDTRFTITIDGVEYKVYTAVYSSYDYNDDPEQSADAAISYHGKTVYILAVKEETESTESTASEEGNSGTEEEEKDNYIIYAIYSSLTFDDTNGYSITEGTDTEITSTLGTPVDNINDRMDGLMNELTIGEITELGDSKLEQKLSTYTINGISKFVDELTLADVIEDVSVNSDSHAIMDYLVYGLTEVAAVTYDVTESETTTTYTKTVTIDGVTYYVYTATHNPLDGSDSYSVYLLVEEELDDENNVTGNYIISAIYTEDSLTEGDKTFTLATTVTDLTSTLGTPVNDINDRMDGLMENLTIGEITDLGDSSIADKLSGYTINELGTFIDELAIADAMGEVTTDDSAVILYVTYGITGLSDSGTDNGDGTYTFTATYHDYKGNTHDAFVVTTAAETTNDSGELVYDDDNNPVYVYTITEVYYCVKDSNGDYVTETDEEGNTVTVKNNAATLVNDVSDRIDGVMGDLTIGELMDTSGSDILDALSDSTIDTLSTDIANLAIQEVFADQIYSQTAAYGDETTSVAAYEYEQYYKVVYESLPSGGTYYIYEVTTYTEESKDADISLKSYSENTGTYTESVTYYIGYSVDTKDADNSVISTTKYTVYWQAAEGGTLYEVVLFSNAYLYYAESDGSLEYVQYSKNALGHINDSYIDESETTTELSACISEYDILYTYGKPAGTWYFMLYSNDVEVVYTIDDINALTTNASNNIENATLYELVEADMLSISSTQLKTEVLADYLSNDLQTKYNSSGSIKTGSTTVNNVETTYKYIELGDLYLVDAINVFVDVLSGKKYSTTQTSD